MSNLSHLECSRCHTHLPAGQVQNLCECGGPLLARYHLDAIKATWSQSDLIHAPKSMWRYAPILPLADPATAVTLGEGFTPLIRPAKLAKALNTPNLLIKDDGINPTGSFKARGLSCAVSMAAQLGVTKIAIPSAGNAAGALSAYAAAAGIEAHVFVPRDVPRLNELECRAFGAHVTLVNGNIGDCGRIVSQRASAEGWFEISTLKEPYRIEGKKTMGLELAEQLHWQLPDAIFYPTGGGVGLIGMWKAFEELEALGWIGSHRPKMIAVQAEGCQPIVRAFHEGADHADPWPNPHTVASGLRVPKPLGDALSLQALRASHGTAIAVSDREALEAAARLAASEGIFASPEGAASLPALEKLLANGFLKHTDKIVLYNTGTGMKYPEAYSVLFPAAETDKLGGLITPR